MGSIAGLSRHPQSACAAVLPPTSAACIQRHGCPRTQIACRARWTAVGPLDAGVHAVPEWCAAGAVVATVFPATFPSLGPPSGSRWPSWCVGDARCGPWRPLAARPPCCLSPVEWPVGVSTLATTLAACLLGAQVLHRAGFNRGLRRRRDLNLFLVVRARARPAGGRHRRILLDRMVGRALHLGAPARLGRSGCGPLCRHCLCRRATVGLATGCAGCLASPSAPVLDRYRTAARGGHHNLLGHVFRYRGAADPGGTRIARAAGDRAGRARRLATGIHRRPDRRGADDPGHVARQHPRSMAVATRPRCRPCGPIWACWHWRPWGCLHWFWK